MTEPSGKVPLVVRAAVSVGQALGHWRQRWVTAVQDAYIDSWKAAWTEGSEARRRGQSQDTPPYRNGVPRDAWRAGWHWADTHPDPPSSSNARQLRQRATSVGPRMVRAARTGAVGLAVVVAARWLWRSRRRN